MAGRITSLLVVALLSVGCHFSAASPSTEIAKSVDRIRINPALGEKAPIPLGEGLTIVNLFEMVQGDIEAISPHLIHGKLLLVLDANGSLVWREMADMSEQQVLSELSN